MTKPEPPSGCLPAALMVAGPVLGLLTMCGGFVGSLTPEEPTISFGTFHAVDAPAHTRMEITSQGSTGMACTVVGPAGKRIAVTQTSRDQYSATGVFLTDAAGYYEVTCPNATHATDSSVTNPASLDQDAADRDDVRRGKVWGIGLGAGVSLLGFLVGVLGRRGYQKQLAAYEAQGAARVGDHPPRS